MTIKIKKPILVVGIGLSLLLWFWQSFQTSLLRFGEFSLLTTMILGISLWWLKSSVKPLPTLKPVNITREKVETAIAEINTLFTQLETEATEQDLSLLKQEINQFPQRLERQELKIAIAGRQKVGKTALKKILETENLPQNITLIDTEPVLTENQNQHQLVIDNILASDLVIFLTDSDLTDSELQILTKFQQLNHRLILALNKQDRHPPEDQIILLKQIAKRLENIIPETNIISIAAVPNLIKVIRHQTDGSIQETTEQPAPEIKPLKQTLETIITQETPNLVLATTWRETLTIKSTLKTYFNQIRKQRALPLIEQYQLIAATTAFANPVASLDLLATVAINGQLIADLSEIYQQKFSLDQGKTIAATLGELMVKLGLVELSTQTLGSLLKSNTITYLAGGALQGVSAAYLTHIAGLSLIEYFQEQDLSISSEKPLNLESLKEKIQQVFQENQRSVVLQNFVKQAVNYF